MSSEPRSARILVADDDEDILQLVAMVLEGEGYETLLARDGEEALKLASAHGPDLCLLDVMMPKLDGCEVTKRLRAQVGTAKTPIVLLSARTQWESVLKGKEAGADEYLTKPFVSEDLEHCVRSLLSVGNEPEEEISPEILALLHRSEPEPEPENEAPRCRVLIAAADQNIVKLVAYRLELAGYEVVVGDDAEGARQLALEQPPHFCVLDDTVNGINGFPVARIETPFDLQQLYGQIETIVRPPAAQSQLA